MDKGVMEILCSKGDDKVFWSPDDDKQVEDARRQFDEYLKKGYTCFRMDNEGNKAGRKITEFPKHAARLLFIPRMVGG